MLSKLIRALVFPNLADMKLHAVIVLDSHGISTANRIGSHRHSRISKSNIKLLKALRL